MPCFDPRDAQYAAEEEHARNAAVKELLCEACHLLKDNDLEALMGLKLRQWWKNHQAEDEARRKEKEERQNLVNIANKVVGNLTPEEIEALRSVHGLNLKKVKP